MVSLTERFEAKIDRDGPEHPTLGRCWIWTGATGSDGYGKFTPESYRSIGAHRQAYLLAYGAIPDGATIDHLCRVRNCVNPAHLEAVSNRENILRGEGAPARNARKTHCPNGHELSEENVYTYPDGRRQCRICRRDYIRDYMRARRAK